MPFKPPALDTEEKSGFTPPSVESEGKPAPFDVSKATFNPGGGVFMPSQFSSGAASLVGARDAGDADFANALFNKLPSDVGTLGRATVADVAAGMRADPDFSGNIPAAIKGEPLPIDAAISDASKESIQRGEGTGASSVARASQSVSAMLPMLATGNIPGAGGKLLMAAMTAKMLEEAGHISTELGAEMGKPENEQDKEKIADLKGQLAATAVNTGLGALGMKGAGKDVAITRGDALRMGVRDLAHNVETMPLETVNPIAQRRLGIKLDPNVLSHPEIKPVVEQAFAELQPGHIAIPGEPTAMQMLRGHMGVDPVTIANAERAGGGPATGGQISFAAPAEAFGIPNALQSRLIDLPRDVVSVEPQGEGVTGPDAPSYRRPTPPPTQAQWTMKQLRENVAKGLTMQETPMEPLPEDVSQFPVEGGPKGTLSNLQRERMLAGKTNVRSGVRNNPPGEKGANAVQSEAAQPIRDVRDEAGQVKEQVSAEINGSETHAGGDQGAAPKEALTAFKEDFTARKKLSTEKAVEAGMGAKSVADLEALNNLRREAYVRQKEIMDQLATEKDPAKRTELFNEAFSLNPQLPREAIEAATNTGSHVEGEGKYPIQIGERPLDWSKNPDVAEWLRKNADDMGITLPEAAKAPPMDVESVTPLEKQSGAPLSATDSLINRLEAEKPVTGKPLTPEQVRTKGILERADARLAEIQQNIRSGKTFTGVAGIEPLVLDAAVTAARGAIKATSSVIKGIEAAVEYIKANHPNVKFNRDELAQWIAENFDENKMARPAAATAATSASSRASAGLDDIYRIFEPTPKEGSSLKQKAVAIVEAVRTGMSSKFRPLNKLAEDIAKSYGMDNPKDVAAIMEQLKGSQGKGEADVYRFDRQVSDLVKGNEKDFNAYMFLRRSLDRLTQDQRDSLNRRGVAGYTIGELTPKLQALEQKIGPETLQKFKQAADQYQQQMDQALRLQVESGRMSQEVYQAIKSGNQFYAPFKVMKYLQETSRPGGTGAKIDTTAEFTKAMEGIEDPNFRLGDMLGAARQNILISRILADKNMAMRSVAELAAFDVDGLFIKKLEPNEAVPHGSEAVTVMENGVPTRYATRPEVAEALQLYGERGNSIISRVLSAFSVPFRAGATALNLPFQISNLLADVPRQALVSKYGVKGVNDLVRYPMDFIHSLYSSIAGDVFGAENKLFLDFMDSGVAGSTVQEHLTPRALRFEEPTSVGKAKALASTVLHTIPNFATAIEQTSKVLGVKRAMRIEGVESGAQLAKDIPEAITELRRFSGSPDFGRQGKWVEQARLNLLYMFLNARIQGAVSDIGRLTGRDGAGTAASTWLKVGTAVGIPTAYLYALNHSKEYHDDYEKRPQQEKQNYWLIPKDSYITTEDGERIRDYWRIPKREIAKWFANATESGLDYYQQRDAKGLKAWAESMIQDISPVNIQGDTAQERMESVGSSLNPVLKAPLEIATGRDMYRHRNLVPDAQKNASPELQFTDRTPEAFKKLAAAMPDVSPEFLRSPIILENLTRNLTAGLITQFLPRKSVEGRSPLENQPLLQRFQALPYTDQQGFRDQIKALERDAADEQLTRHREAVKLLDDGKGKTLEQIVSAAPKDERLIRHMVDLWVAKKNGATAQDRQLLALPAKQRAAYIVQQIRTMTPEQKSRAILDFARKRVLTESVAAEMPEYLK